MLPARITGGLCLMAAFFGYSRPAAANTYQVIVRGKVTMEDGSAPGFSVGIERVCSDLQGTAPGPITNKKGEYLWNMEIDAYRPRSCQIRATHSGYSSSSQDISGINTTSHDTTYTVPTLILYKKVPDPYNILVSSEEIPARAKKPFDAAMKALDKPDYQQAASDLEAAVQNAPKFAAGWHALGIVDERLGKAPAARDAYEHALKVNPKFLRVYVTLARVCLKLQDWACAANTTAEGIKMDAKQVYPQLYLHQAVAQYEQKDLKAAQTSVEEAIRLDPQHHDPREEYVLGRILEAKGDTAGAKEHMATYLKLDPNTPDVDLVKGHLLHLGEPVAADVEPSLEVL